MSTSERPHFCIIIIIGALFHWSPQSAQATRLSDEKLYVPMQPELSGNLKRLPKFWAHTGLCPPAPTNDAIALKAFFGGKSMQICLEMLSALPNMGINTVRIHWLLNLVRTALQQGDAKVVYDFSYLDEFLDKLTNIGLNPVIEFMGDPSNAFASKAFNRWNVVWERLTLQLMQRYIARYGRRTVFKWKFESWNEPDLRGYNTLMFNYSDYSSYLGGIAQGLEAVSSKSHSFLLSGPAGLFKANAKHPLCWGLLASCNANQSTCPINGPITFHRKGVSGNTARQVVEGGIALIRTIFREFPRLRGMSYANSEADPTSGWSKPLPENADVRYAVTLIDIVIEHWHAKYMDWLPNLSGISHDNAFLSYHPYEFEQRTLLARFQMNRTRPPHVQMVEKPVYAALGMLAALGDRAGQVQSTKSGVKYLLTYGKRRDPHYFSAVLICGSIDPMRRIVIILRNASRRHKVYFIEYLERDGTDPVAVWMANGRPAYPNATLRIAMRERQGPRILQPPELVGNNHRIEVTLRPPWVLLIRVCDKGNGKFRTYTINKVRAIQVNPTELQIFWSIVKSPSNRCIRTFQVFHKDIYDGGTSSANWININKDRHNPFQTFHFAASTTKNETIMGLYKVRALDVFGHHGPFSKIFRFVL